MASANGVSRGKELLDLPDERLVEVLALSLRLADDPFWRARQGKLCLALVCRRFRALSKGLDADFVALRITKAEDAEVKRVLDDKEAPKKIKELAVLPIFWRKCFKRDYDIRDMVHRREIVFYRKEVMDLLAHLTSLCVVTVVAPMPVKPDVVYDEAPINLRDVPILRCTETSRMTRLHLYPVESGYWKGDYQFEEYELHSVVNQLTRMLDMAKPLQHLMDTARSFAHHELALAAFKDGSDKVSFAVKIAGGANRMVKQTEKNFTSIFMACRKVQLRTTIVVGDKGKKGGKAHLLKINNNPVEELRISALVPCDMDFVRQWFARFDKMRVLGIRYVNAQSNSKKPKDATPEAVVEVIKALPATLERLCLKRGSYLAGHEALVETACKDRGIELAWED